jgi:hypothetical protein
MQHRMSAYAADAVAAAAASDAKQGRQRFVTNGLGMLSRRQTSAYVSMRQHSSAYVSVRQHTSAFVSIRQHTSAFVSIRQHTSHK